MTIVNEYDRIKVRKIRRTILIGGKIMNKRQKKKREKHLLRAKFIFGENQIVPYHEDRIARRVYWENFVKERRADVRSYKQKLRILALDKQLKKRWKQRNHVLEREDSE